MARLLRISCFSICLSFCTAGDVTGLLQASPESEAAVLRGGDAVQDFAGKTATDFPGATVGLILSMMRGFGVNIPTPSIRGFARITLDDINYVIGNLYTHDEVIHGMLQEISNAMDWAVAQTTYHTEAFEAKVSQANNTATFLHELSLFLHTLHEVEDVYVERKVAALDVLEPIAKEDRANCPLRCSSIPRTLHEDVKDLLEAQEGMMFQGTFDSWAHSDRKFERGGKTTCEKTMSEVMASFNSTLEKYQKQSSETDHKFHLVASHSLMLTTFLVPLASGQSKSFLNNFVAFIDNYSRESHSSGYEHYRHIRDVLKSAGEKGCAL